MKFFEDESCGQCTPCRSGTQKARMLMENGVWDTDLLGELARSRLWHRVRRHRRAGRHSAATARGSGKRSGKYLITVLTGFEAA
jgi:hypothetical protein